MLKSSAYATISFEENVHDAEMALDEKVVDYVKHENAPETKIIIITALATK